MAFLEVQQPHVVAIQETKIDNSVATSELFPETCQYNVFRKDRNLHGGGVRLGVKRVTEPNRTEPTDCTGRSLRKFPIVMVPGFTSVTEPNQRMRYLLLIFFFIISFHFIKLITYDSRFYLFKYHLLYNDTYSTAIVKFRFVSGLGDNLSR